MNNFKRQYRDKGFAPSFESLMRKWKKKVERDGLLKELKKREFYETKGQKERRKLKEGKRRHEKMLRDQEALQLEFRRRR